MTCKSNAEAGIRTPMPVRAADPKSAPDPTDGALPLSDASTGLHRITPNRTGHVIPCVTRRRSPVSLTAPCAHCGEPFTTNRLDVVMCSTACARAAIGVDTIGRCYPAGHRNGSRPRLPAHCTPRAWRV